MLVRAEFSIAPESRQSTRYFCIKTSPTFRKGDQLTQLIWITWQEKIPFAVLAFFRGKRNLQLWTAGRTRLSRGQQPPALTRTARTRVNAQTRTGEGKKIERTAAAAAAAAASHVRTFYCKSVRGCARADPLGPRVKHLAVTSVKL